jgi:hypothetical protein
MRKKCSPILLYAGWKVFNWNTRLSAMLLLDESPSAETESGFYRAYRRATSEYSSGRKYEGLWERDELKKLQDVPQPGDAPPRTVIPIFLTWLAIQQ